MLAVGGLGAFQHLLNDLGLLTLGAMVLELPS
jgi:hypothetical protein